MRLGGRLGSIIFRMVIDRDEFRPRQSHSSGPSWPARWRCTFAFPTAPTHATLTSAGRGRTPPPPPPPRAPLVGPGGGGRGPPLGARAHSLPPGPAPGGVPNPPPGEDQGRAARRSL